MPKIDSEKIIQYCRDSQASTREYIAQGFKTSDRLEAEIAVLDSVIAKISVLADEAAKDVNR